jgi:hypothetical protein
MNIRLYHSLVGSSFIASALSVIDQNSMLLVFGSGTDDQLFENGIESIFGVSTVAGLYTQPTLR